VIQDPRKQAQKQAKILIQDNAELLRNISDSWVDAAQGNIKESRIKMGLEEIEIPRLLQIVRETLRARKLDPALIESIPLEKMLSDACQKLGRQNNCAPKDGFIKDLADSSGSQASRVSNFFVMVSVIVILSIIL